MDAIVELFSTRGRVNRGWYFAHILLDDVLLVSTFFGMGWVAATFGLGWVFLPMVGAAMAVTWAAVAVTVKRFHDIGESGWNFLWLCVPLVNIYFGFKLLFKKGQVGSNAYGRDPLQIAEEARGAM